MKKQQRKTQKNKKTRQYSDGGSKKSKKTIKKSHKKSIYSEINILITNNNIRFFISEYLNGKKHNLPLNLKDLPIGKWDVSNVTDMYNLFSGEYNFNEDISEWDVSNVIDMSYMFSGLKYFNQPLNDWDVSNVIDMSFMFSRAENFNQPLNKWDVSNVTNMSFMFTNSKNFEQNLNLWNISNVTQMPAIFNETKMKPEFINRWEFSLANNNNRYEYTGYLISEISQNYINLSKKEKQKLKEENEKLRESIFRKKKFKERKPFLEVLEETDKEYKKGNQISTEPEISKFLENEDWNKELMEYI